MAYKECFNCERQYDSATETSGGFCTLECEENFTRETQAEIELAKQVGLVDEDGESILSEQAPSAELRAANDFLLSKFNIKVKG
jgi:hypothetical protein